MASDWEFMRGDVVIYLRNNGKNTSSVPVKAVKTAILAQIGCSEIFLCRSFCYTDGSSLCECFSSCCLEHTLFNIG